MIAQQPFNRWKIKGAVQEERFTRVKHDSSFPENSINYLLKNESISYDDLDYVTFYEKPLLNLKDYLTHIFKIRQMDLNHLEHLAIWLQKIISKNSP